MMPILNQNYPASIHTEGSNVDDSEENQMRILNI